MMAILIEKRRRRRRKASQASKPTAKTPQHHKLKLPQAHEALFQNNQQHLQAIGRRLGFSRPAIRQHCKVRLGPLCQLTCYLALLLSACQVGLAGRQSQQQMQPAAAAAGFYGSAAASGQPVIVAGKGKYNTNTACEDKQLAIECELGTSINLIRANFGRFSVTQCNEQGQLDLSTDCMSPITFRIMRERCQDRQRCSVNATSAIFGDRCPKTRKYLEVHYQCQPQQQQLPSTVASEEPERVNVRNLTGAPAGGPSSSVAPSSSILPPNNPPAQQAAEPARPQPASPPAGQQQQQQQQQQTMMTVMNSEMLSYNSLAGPQPPAAAAEPIVVALRHTHTENMSNARCVLWDPAAGQWTERGSRVLDSNQTHTLCAFDQPTSYLLVMDYLAPSAAPPGAAQPAHSSQPAPAQQQQQPQQSAVPQIGPPFPNMLDLQPVLLEAASKPASSLQPQQQQPPAQQLSPSAGLRLLSLLGYLLASVFLGLALLTLAFVLSSMRAGAGAALKTLGSFAPFAGPKGSRARALDATGGSLNKDLLVINSQSGHQFLYAPAQPTKISASASTHILRHQHLHQQPLYATSGTLSNLSAAHSNNYYGLTGLAPYFQQQQQQPVLFANQYQPAANQQSAASYLHQANKSTISSESANSSPSSSGVESGATSVQQQQQQQQQHCLMLSSDYSLMNQLAGYAQHQNQLVQQQQPTLTLNAHYSAAGNQLAGQVQRNQTLQREHIYESVDDQQEAGRQSFAAAAHLLLPDQHPFGSSTLAGSASQQQQHLLGSRTLSSRAFQQQQQQQHGGKRLFPQPAIVRDGPQTAKTNIICSKLAQVTPQRATELPGDKFQQDMLAIYSGTCTDTTSATSNHYTTSLLSRKLSTDC